MQPIEPTQDSQAPFPAWMQLYIADNYQDPMHLAYQQMRQMFVLKESNLNEFYGAIEKFRVEQRTLCEINDERVTEVNNLRERLAGYNGESLFVKQSPCVVTPFDASRVRRVDTTLPTFNGYSMPLQESDRFQQLSHDLRIMHLECNWHYQNAERLKQSNEALGDEIARLRGKLRSLIKDEEIFQKESRIGRWSPTAFGTPSPRTPGSSAERPRHV